MPSVSGLVLLCALIAASAATIAEVIYLHGAATTASVSLSVVNHSLMVLTAMSEATSPAFIPPMPSQTTSSAPFSPSDTSASAVKPQELSDRLSSN